MKRRNRESKKAKISLQIKQAFSYFYLKSRYKRSLVKLRANIEPLCSWTYPASEWKHYADVYNLSSNPIGPAKIKITDLDVWIDDDKNSLRIELDDNTKGVTDCRFANNILKFRVRWWETYGKGGKYYYVNDFSFPVPLGEEKAATMIIDHFKNQIATYPNKVINITPKETFTGLFGETDF